MPYNISYKFCPYGLVLLVVMATERLNFLLCHMCIQVSIVPKGLWFNTALTPFEYLTNGLKNAICHQFEMIALGSPSIRRLS